MTDHLPLEESSIVSVSESMTVEDVYLFLLNHGIPDCFCEAFKGKLHVGTCMFNACHEVEFLRILL